MVAVIVVVVIKISNHQISKMIITMDGISTIHSRATKTDTIVLKAIGITAAKIMVGTATEIIQEEAKRIATGTIGTTIEDLHTIIINSSIRDGMMAVMEDIVLPVEAVVVTETAEIMAAEKEGAEEVATAIEAITNVARGPEKTITTVISDR